VAYIRLRHGDLTVRCPDVGGELVYEAEPEGDGCFEDEERDPFLRHAAAAILRWIDKNQEPLPGLEEYRVDFDSAPNVPYTLEDFQPFRWEDIDLEHIERLVSKEDK
jgi:hypothetical protein